MSKNELGFIGIVFVSIALAGTLRIFSTPTTESTINWVVERTITREEQFKINWDSMSDEEKALVQDQAMWMARVLLSEDKREEPWIMMASIIRNRELKRHRGKKTVWGVIHDEWQFSAVRTTKWRRYKNLNLESGNKKFNRAYQIALEVIVLGVPARYTGITHAYYPDTMTGAYGYSKGYPTWDTPNSPMDGRNEVDGWVYGIAP